ncbi:lanthionine synthetase C family protein [Candidatus Protochlamydia sp. W-9]|uniref:lanthionine synthetase C family protein n=1 Tax=Candidatus Protochlamydia sp. W-9 TaxID=1785087 RepID=UPI00096AB69B|nr:lanthionine synthetase C family protein [Candidatus Protochlamydia sp. W-9]
MYHALDICQSVAHKLSEPNQLMDAIENAIKNKKYYADSWERHSFTYGFAGIAAFFAIMDASFPGQNYDINAHEYLKLAVEALEKNRYTTISLFTGITGLCVAVLLCSKLGIRYKKLTERLDLLLIQEIQYHLFNKNFSENSFISPEKYNLADGLGGILTYISMRKDNTHLQSVGSAYIKKLALDLQKKCELNLSSSVPGWFVSSDHYIANEEKQTYPNGCFLLNSQYGITGYLSALAIAALEGFCPDEGYELMRQISIWLKQKQGLYTYGKFWNHTLSIEEESTQQIREPELNRDTWCTGIPAVTRALYLTSKALRDCSLESYAEDAFISMWSKPEKEWNLLGTSFCYGRAGHLAVTYRMAKDTGSVFLKNKLLELEESLKRFYDPNAPFGFRSVGFNDSNDYMWVDDPGLYSGAAGIALSLLMLHKEEIFPWDRAFVNI